MTQPQSWGDAPGCFDTAPLALNTDGVWELMEINCRHVAMFSKRIGYPSVERHLLAIASAHEVRLAGKQALRRSKPDKILRRFDLRFAMFVLNEDVRHSLLRGMRLPVADESGVGGLDSMKEKGDRLLERFGGTSRNSAANC